jgi:hypothetical protein
MFRNKLSRKQNASAGMTHQTTQGDNSPEDLHTKSRCYGFCVSQAEARKNKRSQFNLLAPEFF